MSTRSEQLVDSYLEATSCLMDAKISALTFDKTLPYSITKNDRKGKGIYTVTDNEITFDVYSEYYDLEIGQKVYVTIPNGDFSSRKFITNIIQDEEKTESQYHYRFPMDSLILDDEEINLDSESLIANYGENNSKKQCKFGEIQSYYGYLDSSLTRIVVSCKIQTLLQDYNITSGHYGFGAIMLTKNLSLGYDNYDDAEAMMLDLIQSNNFETIQDGIDYLNSLNNEITNELGKVTNYWTLHNLQVSNTDMIGNLYKFQDQQLQAKAFDVSQLNSLSFIIPYVYQEGDFKQSGLTSIFELEYPDEPDANILYSDLKISWGYGQEDYEEDTLILGYYGNGVVEEENELVVKLIRHSSTENINYLYKNSGKVKIELDVGSFGSLVGGWNIVDNNFDFNERKMLNYSDKGVNTATLMSDYKPYIALRATYMVDMTTNLTSDSIYLFRDAISYQDLITTFDLYVKNSGGIIMNNFYLYGENGTILDLNNFNQAYYAEANLPMSYLRSTDTISFKWIIPSNNSMIQCPLKNLPNNIEQTYIATFDQLNNNYFNNEVWYNSLKERNENVEINDISDEINEPYKRVTITYNQKNEICIEYKYLNKSALNYAQQSVVTYNKFYFFIDKEYRENKSNNFIACSVNENSKAQQLLTFGTQNVYGSKYSFYIDTDNTEDYKSYIETKTENGTTKYSSVRLIPQLTCIRENPPTAETTELMQKAVSVPMALGTNEGIEWSLENNNNTFLKGEVQQRYNKLCYEIRVDESKLIKFKRNCSLVKCSIKIEGKIYTQYYSIGLAQLGSPVISLTFNPAISYTHQGGLDDELILDQSLGIMLNSKINTETYINNEDHRYWRDKDSKLSFNELNNKDAPITIFKRKAQYQKTIGIVVITKNSYALKSNTYYYFKSPASAYFLVYIGPNADYGVLMGKKESNSYYLDPDKIYTVYEYKSNGEKGKELGTIGISRPQSTSTNTSAFDYKKVLQTGFLPVNSAEIFNNLSFSSLSHDIGVAGENPKIGGVATFNTQALIPCLNILNIKTNTLVTTVKITKCLKAIGIYSGKNTYDKYIYVLERTITDSIPSSENYQLLLSNSKDKSMDYINKTDYTLSAYARVKVKRIGDSVKMLLPNYSISVDDFPGYNGYYIGKLKKELSNDPDGITIYFPNGATENTKYQANSSVNIGLPLGFDATIFSENEEYYYLYQPIMSSGAVIEQNTIQEDGLVWAIEINQKNGNGVQVVASNSNALTVIPEIGSPLLESKGTKTTLSPYPLFIQGDQTYCISVYRPNNTSLELLWHQPLVIKQNLYKEEILNNWTGELVLDDVSQLIMSSTLGAGKKDENNLFSGVFMGAVSNVTDDELAKYGIYGYTQGRQAFGFRDDGTAFIGSAGRGRILFDGNESSITSGGFKEFNPGVHIDLDDGIFELHINTQDDNNLDDAQFVIKEVDMLNADNNINIIELTKNTQILGKENNLQIDLKNNEIINPIKIIGKNTNDEAIVRFNKGEFNSLRPIQFGDIGELDYYNLGRNCKMQNLHLPFSTGYGDNEKKYEINLWNVLNYLYYYITLLDKKANNTTNPTPPTLIGSGIQEALANTGQVTEIE